MFKNKKIVMSITCVKTDIFMLKKWNRLFYKYDSDDLELNELQFYKHLNIISEEHIVVDDWIYNEERKSVVLVDCEANAEYANATNYRWKIIASTDKSLGLPIISDDIVVKFIEEHNNNRPIGCVRVEYDLMYLNANGLWLPFPDHLPEHDKKYVLRVYQDNNVSIEHIKESWSREEAIELAKKGYDEGHSDARISLGEIYDQDGFINSNF